ncbi:NAD-dependent succinate-semialdehyde dehydrogenase [Sulfitobacter sp. EhC04]|uniref:NAD-dependent succinate-semialdehyde dehydrogenase n=1 Tax=Sulfitobacter sp. EhC04 TaxID=1849168 RepID=UPI0007F46AB9|nr:NAD-dependent succinate-semialdehyde dehydrogenase [Sulfitobacter sp. EhC04]OAN75946.1 NAD-dependent succinate-semialdehyde dehydrogenase [Sulfitobacter sp. EhC04]
MSESSAVGRPAYPKIGLLIDNQWITDRNAYCEIENPSDESILGIVPEATAKDLDNALAAAARGFETWSATPPVERSQLLKRAATILRERKTQISAVFTLEQGRPLHETIAEVERSATFLDWDAEQLLRAYGRIVPGPSSIQQSVVREPVGPVAAFTPWNVPVSAPSRKISAALAAGCSVVMKPADETPASTCMFAQCFLDAGLPKGVLNIVFGDPAAISEKLVRSPVIRMVTLTGSLGVGKHLTRLAADGMKPVLMELGGHAPVIIDQDVNAEEIGRLASEAKFRLVGQYCTAPSRFLVHKNVYERFVESFAAAAKSIVVGDGFKPGVYMGPMIHRRRMDAIDSLVTDAVSRGARAASGGARIGNRGYFYEPTVLADVPRDARVMSEEPFGPLAACLPVSSMAEALEISNELPVGLAAYMFSNSIETVNHLSRQLQVGSVSVNLFTSPGNDAPFGGYKESGIGREGGAESVESYMVTKTIAHRLMRV